MLPSIVGEKPSHAALCSSLAAAVAGYDSCLWGSIWITGPGSEKADADRRKSHERQGGMEENAMKQSLVSNTEGVRRGFQGPTSDLGLDAGPTFERRLMQP